MARILWHIQRQRLAAHIYLEESRCEIPNFINKTGEGKEGYLRDTVINHLKSFKLNETKEAFLDQWRIENSYEKMDN